MRRQGHLSMDKYGSIQPENHTVMDDILLVRGVALPGGNGRQEGEDNAAHIIACWNAIEAIGGDPETVGKLAVNLEEMLRTHGDDDPSCCCAQSRSAKATLELTDEQS